MQEEESTNLRKYIFSIIEPSSKFNTRASQIYDIIIIVFIFASIVPLFFKGTNDFFLFLDYISAAIFIFDYAMRWLTADLKLNKGKGSFALYPVTPWAIIDLLSIIPVFGLLTPSFVLLRTLRIFRVFRVFKGLRYSKNFELIANVFKNNKRSFITLAIIAGAYIIISALIVFNVEPDTFQDYFDALYWSVTALTTVGYGDLYPITDAGRVVSMISSLVGIAIVALPSGIITAGFMEELNRNETDSPNIPLQIRDFKVLYDEGILTQEEYERKKKQLLEL